MLVRQHGEQAVADLDEQLVETRAGGEEAGEVGEPEQRLETVGKILGETADLGLGVGCGLQALADLDGGVPTQGEAVASGRVGVLPAVGVGVDDETAASALG
jgi:hypothetical protein